MITLLKEIRKCLTKVVDSVCRKCSDFTDNIEVDKKVSLDDDVAKFSYLGDILSSGEVQETVTTRIRYELKKFKNIASVLCKRVWSLKLRESMYKSCVSCVMVPSVELSRKMRESCKLLKWK